MEPPRKNKRKTHKMQLHNIF